MPRIRDRLARFRPLAPPGAPSAMGVPVDAAREAAAELDWIFRRLEATNRACARITEQAALQADAIRTRGTQQATRIRAEAHAAVPAARSAAAEQRRRGDEATAARRRAAAERTATALSSRAAERIPGYVERVVAVVAAQLDGAAARPPDGPR